MTKIFPKLGQIPRHFSISAGIGSKLLPPIQGLYIHHNFLQGDQKDKLQEKVAELCKEIFYNSSSSPAYNCKTYVSQHHNLKSSEHFRLVQIKDASNAKIKGQHFERYGEEGHSLTYFIGNDNLPQFIKNTLMPYVLRIPEIVEMSQGRHLNCNFTFNTYTATKEPSPKLSGFGFHKDIPSNGEITMIYSLGSESEFHIRHPKDIANIQAFPLVSNSLLLLSKEARWDYEHCVVPVKIQESDQPLVNTLKAIKRISLVLGFHK